MMTKIKICGIRDQQTIDVCEELAVDYLGFNLIKSSPRYVEPAQCVLLLDTIKQALPVVLVKHEDINEYLPLLRHSKVHAVQIYEAKSISQLESVKNLLGKKIIFSVPVNESIPLAEIEEVSPYVDYFLFDAKHSSLLGGSGKRFNWNLLNDLKLKVLKPFFVAGGINEHNVNQAMASSEPYAVDIASGAEKDGKKDPEKIKNIVLKIRS